MTEFSEEEIRAFQSDSGRKLLEQMSWWPDDKPVGNANLSMVLQFVAWGVFGKRGLTAKGRRAFKEFRR